MFIFLLILSLTQQQLAEKILCGGTLRIECHSYLGLKSRHCPQSNLQLFQTVFLCHKNYYLDENLKSREITIYQRIRQIERGSALLS